MRVLDECGRTGSGMRARFPLDREPLQRALEDPDEDPARVGQMVHLPRTAPMTLDHPGRDELAQVQLQATHVGVLQLTGEAGNVRDGFREDQQFPQAEGMGRLAEQHRGSRGCSTGSSPAWAATWCVSPLSCRAAAASRSAR